MTTQERPRVRIEDAAKRVRVYLGGALIADSTHARLVWEKPYYPTYYFPTADVRMEKLAASGGTRRSPSRGDARLFTVQGGDRKAVDAAYQHADSPVPELQDLIAFDWNSMSGWFEEDEEVLVHARDPYTRIDALRSSRHIEVVVNGVKVADSHHPTLLFETGLPTRYYLPKVDVRMDLLLPTQSSTECPYKGTAQYWSVAAGGDVLADIAWSYQHPVQESAKIAGLVCFYNEKVDIYVDGELEARPSTVFS